MISKCDQCLYNMNTAMYDNLTALLMKNQILGDSNLCTGKHQTLERV